MTATMQLFLALGFGRFALLADLAFVALSTVATFALIARSRRSTATANRGSHVVAEAESVVAGAAERQPV